MKAIRFLSFLFALSLCFTSFAGDRQLTAFDAVLKALDSGHLVRMVVHYKDCQLVSDNKIAEHVPDAVGGMTIDTFEYFAPGSVGNQQGFISASKTILIQHPTRGMVHNYAKVRIHADDKVQIMVRYLKPGTLEVVMDESFYTTIADGKGGGAAAFYLLK